MADVRGKEEHVVVVAAAAAAAEREAGSEIVDVQAAYSTVQGEGKK